MFIAQPYYTHTSTSSDIRPSAHVPMIYEPAPRILPRWEYHVLAVDPREVCLPDADQLNAFGCEGWVLVGILEEHMAQKGKLIHYYFVRQAKD